MMAKESEKLDIDDIKDPLDELDKGEEVDLEEAVDEEAPVEEKVKAKEEPVKEVKAESKEEEPDELEKAVAEPTVAEEKELPEKAEEEKAKKKKKPFPWKMIAIIFVTILVTAALVMGGLYLYNKYGKRSDEKVETPAPTSSAKVEVAKPETTQKVVYVTATDGLNLRKSPSATAEKLTVIPFGTKLDVLATQGSWYQVTYNSLTGWVDSTYTGAENPLVYRNSDYRFETTFPTDWAAYKLFLITGDTTETAGWYVGLPTTDTTYVASGVDKGYANMFAVIVYTPAQWTTVKNEGGPVPTVAVQNQDWVVVYSAPNGIMAKDLIKQATETKSIVATIKFY